MSFAHFSTRLTRGAGSRNENCRDAMVCAMVTPKCVRWVMFVPHLGLLSGPIRLAARRVPAVAVIHPAEVS